MLVLIGSFGLLHVDSPAVTTKRGKCREEVMEKVQLLQQQHTVFILNSEGK